MKSLVGDFWGYMASDPAWFAKPRSSEKSALFVEDPPKKSPLFRKTCYQRLDLGTRTIRCGKKHHRFHHVFSCYITSECQVATVALHILVTSYWRNTVRDSIFKLESGTLLLFLQSFASKETLVVMEKNLFRFSLSF